MLNLVPTLRVHFQCALGKAAPLIFSVLISSIRFQTAALLTCCRRIPNGCFQKREETPKIQFFDQHRLRARCFLISIYSNNFEGVQLTFDRLFRYKMVRPTSSVDPAETGTPHRDPNPALSRFQWFREETFSPVPSQASPPQRKQKHKPYHGEGGGGK